MDDVEKELYVDGLKYYTICNINLNQYLATSIYFFHSLSYIPVIYIMSYLLVLFYSCIKSIFLVPLWL